MKRNWKLVLMAFLLVFALGFVTACRGDAEEAGVDVTPAPPPQQGQQQQAATPTPAPTPEPEPPRDLGGITITHGVWWGNGWDTETATPTTAEGEARLEDRIYLEQKHNFRFIEVNLGDWGEVRSLIPVEIMAGTPAASIHTTDVQWFTNWMNQGLFAPLRDEWFDPVATGIPVNWTTAVIDATRLNGIPHGFTNEVMVGGGIYFNERLLEEAGLSRELPFDLQLSGEWTWPRLMEIAHATTRDVDGDGIMDTYGVASFSVDILEKAVFSNMSYVGGRDANGVFYHVTNSAPFLEALTFVNNLHVEGVLMPQPEGSAWNWFDQAFWNAQVAMRSGNPYMAGAHINANLADPWGYVTFPMGPRANTHMVNVNVNPHVIPATFSEDEASDFVFAWSVWNRTMPEWDDPDAWRFGNYPNHSNPRSVDETLAMFLRNPALQRVDMAVWIGGLGIHHFAWNMWHEDSDPMVIVENAQERFNTRIYEMNNPGS